MGFWGFGGGQSADHSGGREIQIQTNYFEEKKKKNQTGSQKAKGQNF